MIISVMLNLFTSSVRELGSASTKKNQYKPKEQFLGFFSIFA